jgi:hypothetical protein
MTWAATWTALRQQTYFPRAAVPGTPIRGVYFQLERGSQHPLSALASQLIQRRNRGL